MIPTLSDQLTAQFYQWEQRGRGWQFFEQPVELEPHFHPFFFHFAPPATKPIDDGKRHTIFSLIGEAFKSKPKPTADPYAAYADNEEMGLMFACDEPLKIFSIALPKGHKIDPEATQHLLLMLSYCRYPITFEIYGSSSAISLQLACRQSDAGQVASQVKAYFPGCIIKERADLLEEIVSVESNFASILHFGLRDEFMRPLKMSDSFKPDPLIGILGTLEHLMYGEHAVIQIMFQGAINPWAESIMRAVTDGSGKPFFENAPEMVPLAKEKIASPLFGVIMRVMGVSHSVESAHHISNMVGSALGRIYFSESNSLIPIQPPLDFETILDDVLLRESHLIGMLLNSRELATVVHLPSDSVVSDKLVIASRVAASIPIRAQLGKSLGGTAPLGYKWVGEKGQKKDFVVDERHAPVRKLVYELFLKYRRKKVVAKILNDAGHRSRTGKKFSDTTICQLLRDPSAKGERRVNYSQRVANRNTFVLKPTSEWSIHPCPALVSVDVWNECNRILDDSLIKNKKPGPRAKHLLAGYVYCADCSKKMYVFHASKFPTYRCPGCKNRIVAGDIEEIYHDQLKTFLLSGVSVSEYLEKIDSELQEREKMLSVILNERESLNKKMDVFINMRMNNELSKDVFAEKYRPMEERLIQLNNQLPELQAEIDFLKIQHRSSDVVLSDATDLYTHWDSLDLDAKRTIVETITDKITVGKEDIHIKMSYLPTKQAQTAEPTQSKNDPHNSNQNPVKRQSNLIRTLPFSHVDISIPVRPKGYTENPKTIGEHLIRSWAYPMYFLPNWKTYSTSGQRCVSQTAK